MQTQPAQTARSPISSLAVDRKPQLVAVHPDKLHDLITAQPYVLQAFEGVAQRSRGRYSVESILNQIARKNWVLWVVWDGVSIRSVLATELAHEISGMKVCNLPFCTGNNAEAWVHLMAEIEDWARSEGCQKIGANMRKGWSRMLPDYKMTHVYLEKDL